MASPAHDDVRGRREAIEAQLRAELEEAKRQYDKAKEEYRKASVLVADLDRRSPDGSHVFLQAATEQRRAIERYSKALQNFNAFVLRRTVL
jgi:hypothetical protein